MSQTKSPDCFTADHWHIVSQMTARQLEEIVAKGKIEGKEIPPGNVVGIRKFLKLALDSSKDVMPNPPANLQAFDLANQVFAKEPLENSTDPAKYAALRNFFNFMKDVRTRRQLSPHDIIIAKALITFLKGLCRVSG